MLTSNDSGIAGGSTLFEFVHWFSHRCSSRGFTIDKQQQLQQHQQGREEERKEEKRRERGAWAKKKEKMVG